MFVVADQDTIKKTLKFEQSLDYGKKKKHQVDVEWKVLELDEKKDILESLGKDGPSDEDILMDLVVDIKGLVDADKEPMEFNAELFSRLLQKEFFRDAITGEMMDMLLGKGFAETVKAKNLQKLAGTGLG